MKRRHLLPVSLVALGFLLIGSLALFLLLPIRMNPGKLLYARQDVVWMLGRGGIALTPTLLETRTIPRFAGIRPATFSVPGHDQTYVTILVGWTNAQRDRAFAAIRAYRANSDLPSASIAIAPHRDFVGHNVLVIAMSDAGAAEVSEAFFSTVASALSLYGFEAVTP
jgi:hypothetical protein